MHDLRLLQRIPELDLVLGPQYSGRLGDLLDDVQQNHCQVSATQPIHIQEDLSKPRRGSPTTAWLNVIYGCNERCVASIILKPEVNVHLDIIIADKVLWLYSSWFGDCVVCHLQMHLLRRPLVRCDAQHLFH